MDQPIKVQGAIERDDFVAAYLLAERSRRMMVRLVIMAMGTVVFFMDFIVGLGLFALLYTQIAGAVMFVYGLVGTDLILILRLRTMFKKDPSLAGQQLDMTFSQAGIDTGGAVKAMLPWAKLAGWREDGLNILIYIKAKRWFPVPKRLAPEDRVDDLRALLTDKLGKAGSLPSDSSKD